MRKAKRLKVFQARLGFWDTVVAAPSQAAALRAWGVHQNLFAAGEAEVTTDSGAVKAALADPGTPLKRAVGSKAAFERSPAGLPEPPDAAPRRKARKAPAAPRPPKPAADRGPLDAAEEALRRLEEARREEERDLGRRQVALAEEKAEAKATYLRRREAATQAVAQARAAFRKAGGKVEGPA